MSTTGLGIDLSGIDPNLLMGPNNQTANAVSSSGGSLMNNDAGVGPDEVVPAEGETIDANSTVKTTGIDTTLLSTVSGETANNTPQIAGADGSGVSNSIDVESVKPDFTLDPDWQSTGFDGDGSTWTENTDGTFTQNLDINLGGRFGTQNVSYDFTKDGDFIGVSDGSRIPIVGSTQEDSLPGATAEDSIVGGAGNDTLKNVSTINTEPIELANGNLAYGFDSNGDGELDTYRIEDGTGAEVETINADQFTGVDYAGGEIVNLDVSTDASYLTISGNLLNTEEGENHPWLKGSTDEDGDGIPDGIMTTGLTKEQLEEHTFPDGSKGFIFATDIPANEFITEAIQFNMYWNKDGQLVDANGAGREGMTTLGTKTDALKDDVIKGVGNTGLDQEAYDTV
mgnify:CR=1 FL=1